MRRIPRAALTLLPVLALLLGACGSSRGTSGDSDATAPDLPGPDVLDEGPAPLAPGMAVELSDGWRIRSSTVPLEAKDPPWHPAPVPSTVVGALVLDGTIPDPYPGKVLRTIPGMTDAGGAEAYPIGANFVDSEIPDWSPFKASWWYRTTLPRLPASLDGLRVWLQLDGVNYRANVFVNGTKIAGADEIVGTYRAFNLDVTAAARPGDGNEVAIEVFAPDIQALAHSWVDWNPTPPDKNMGLWRPVRIAVSGPVAVRHPFAQVDLSDDRKTARLTLFADVLNPTDLPVNARLTFRVTPPDVPGGPREAVSAFVDIEVPARGSMTVSIDPDQAPALVLHDPVLWWPWALRDRGQPWLHALDVDLATADGQPSDIAAVRFGIREVETRLLENGAMQYRVNGQPILILAAGWARDMLLMDTPLRELTEIDMVQHLGLNAVRFEGKFPSDRFLDRADERGLLVIPGWCCCDNWERQWMWPLDEALPGIARASMRDQALAMRNRASVLTFWYGSDAPPDAETEQLYLDALQETRFPMPTVSSASEQPGSLTGPSGVKMNGPYEWVPPNYWLTDTRNGGAFGFATEISPGPAVPEVESLTKMLGADHLWPIDDTWSFHCGGNEFQSLGVFTGALEGRFGAAEGVQDYARKAQLMTYEAQRAMFEGFSRNRYTATGVVQWMLNNAWPSLIWHLYDQYLAAGGGYYGTRKACEPVHAMYGYDDGAVWVVNQTSTDYGTAPGSPAPPLGLQARLLTVEGRELWRNSASIPVGPDTAALAFAVPVPQGVTGAYLLLLEGTGDGGRPLGSNLYWLSTQADVLDYAGTPADKEWFYTATSQYADFRSLTNLPKVALDIQVKRGGTPPEPSIDVTLANPSTSLAFFLRLKVVDAAGAEILPTFWEDNFVTLLPGQARTVNARWSAQAQGASGAIGVGVEGMNVDRVETRW
jgi:exo-1,4-beta-D-glucosaminidase